MKKFAIQYEKFAIPTLTFFGYENNNLQFIYLKLHVNV